MMPSYCKLAQMVTEITKELQLYPNCNEKRSSRRWNDTWARIARCSSSKVFIVGDVLNSSIEAEFPVLISEVQIHHIIRWGQPIYRIARLN